MCIFTHYNRTFHYRIFSHCYQFFYQRIHTAHYINVGRIVGIGINKEFFFCRFFRLFNVVVNLACHYRSFFSAYWFIKWMSGYSLCSFIMYGASRVIIFNPSGHGSMIWSTSRFIAKRPHKHRGVISVSHHHADCAFHIWSRPFRTVGQIAFLMMSLKISFIHNINPIFIA